MPGFILHTLRNRKLSGFSLSLLIATVASLSGASLVSAQAAPKEKTTPVTITGAITLVESAQESGPVQRATKDLQNDFKKVFGQAPKVVSDLKDAGPTAILIAQRENLPSGVDCATTSDAEAFAFSVAGAGVGPTHHRIVCLTGADMRGTIYAIYQFSQSVLGVDPMYLWTDKQPARRVSISLPADFTHTYPSPVFKYRGFFPNDEDLLTGWVVPPKGEQDGIALSVWDQIYETILRLKGNIVVPGTWTFPDDAPVHAATERGLIVNQHHAIPLGVNVARWPANVPYNFSTDSEILRRAWTNAVAEYKPDEEILWSVGLRGLSDSSYATLDPSVRNNDPLLGKRISEAVAEQMKIVRAKYPHAQFVTDLWQEGARLTREGYLKIPPEVTLVWADTGYGDLQDDGKVAAGQGMYIHTAMMNGNANQLSEMVPVERIDEELGRYIKAGATAYVLINTSDLRPVAMTTRAVMDAAWGGVPAEKDADMAYYRRWATEEFGAKSADALASLYRDYFAAPSLRRPFNGFPGMTSAGNAPPPPPPTLTFTRWDGDQHYHSEARRLILDDLSVHQVIAIPSQSPKWTQPRVFPGGSAEMRARSLDNDIKDGEDAAPRWDAVWKKAVAAESLIDPARRSYYQAQVLTMITINRESNAMLLDLARAMKDADAGDKAKAEQETAASIAALDAIQKSMALAEYGKWKNWYRGDWLTGIYRTRELAQDYLDHLKDPMAKLPAPASWSGWEAYFHIMAYEGDRSVDVQ
jgi:hypothetical protein